jgi:hypothetical protein
VSDNAINEEEDDDDNNDDKSEGDGDRKGIFIENDDDDDFSQRRALPSSRGPAVTRRIARRANEVSETESSTTTDNSSESDDSSGSGGIFRGMVDAVDRGKARRRRFMQRSQSAGTTFDASSAISSSSLSHKQNPEKKKRRYIESGDETTDGEDGNVGRGDRGGDGDGDGDEVRVNDQKPRRALSRTFSSRLGRDPLACLFGDDDKDEEDVDRHDDRGGNMDAAGRSDDRTDLGDLFADDEEDDPYVIRIREAMPEVPVRLPSPPMPPPENQQQKQQPRQQLQQQQQQQPGDASHFDVNTKEKDDAAVALLDINDGAFFDDDMPCPSADIFSLPAQDGVIADIQTGASPLAPTAPPMPKEGNLNVVQPSHSHAVDGDSAGNSITDEFFDDIADDDLFAIVDDVDMDVGDDLVPIDDVVPVNDKDVVTAETTMLLPPSSRDHSLLPVHVETQIEMEMKQKAVMPPPPSSPPQALSKAPSFVNVDDKANGVPSDKTLPVPLPPFPPQKVNVSPMACAFETVFTCLLDGHRSRPPTDRNDFYVNDVAVVRANPFAKLRRPPVTPPMTVLSGCRSSVAPFDGVKGTPVVGKTTHMVRETYFVCP